MKCNCRRCDPRAGKNIMIKTREVFEAKLLEDEIIVSLSKEIQEDEERMMAWNDPWFDFEKEYD